MTTQVTMPELGESISEGVVTRWLKSVGEEVLAEEPLLEVATDKVDTEIPSPVAGVLLSLSVAENDTVPVGATIAVIASVESGASGSPEASEPTPVERQPEVKQPAAAPLSAAAPVATAPAAPATPQAPLTPPTPKTGPAVPAVPAPESESAETPPAQPVTRTEPMTRMRQTIARRMVASLQTSAQLTSVVEADVTELVRLRRSLKDQHRERTGTGLSLLPFLARAAIESLPAHPMLNASVNDDDTATFHGPCHLGIAVDTPRGLMVPVVRDADRLDVTGLALAIADVAGRTRSGRISPDELGGGTFTITNTGSRGALFDTPILNQPQTGILGTGAVVERVVPVPVESGGHVLAVRSMMFLSVTYDHRLVDGADAARFLSAVKAYVERAEFQL